MCYYECIYNCFKYSILLTLLIIIIINIKIECLHDMHLYEYIKIIILGFIITFIIYLYYLFYLFICKKNNNIIVPEEIII